MQVLQQFISGPDICHYLPDRLATQQYASISQLSPAEYEDLMNRGWRKFGTTLFRPICAHCEECRPLRILTDRFTPDRSQQRAWRKNAGLEVRFAPPSVDAARLDLYRRYQASQTAAKGWPDTEGTAKNYARQFVQNPLPSIEISLWDGDALRAVVITDITPNCVSGVYHFHDPECRAQGLGTHALLHMIELARRLGKPWVYLGFYVAGNASMAYKTRFRPHEILQPDGVWAEMRV